MRELNPMTTPLRWLLVTVLAGHGLIHLLGAAKGFGLADVWNDARAGTIVNLVLVLAAGYGLVTEGRPRLRAQHR